MTKTSITLYVYLRTQEGILPVRATVDQEIAPYPTLKGEPITLYTLTDIHTSSGAPLWEVCTDAAKERIATLCKEQLLSQHSDGVTIFRIRSHA